MTEAAAAQNSISRMLAFGQRARAVMIEKGLNKARRSCPWCKAKGGLEIHYNEKFNPDFTIKCTATPNCMDYKERKTTPK